ncbi:MAG: histidine kinase [Armatimonadetes bacterium]|nr:histidine kinase [Armatimonadota bacterium]
MLWSLLPNSYILNRFLEDTCVLVAVAYLVSRGALLPRLFSRHARGDRLMLAAVFALMGASEIVFPGDRYPYVPYTLAAAFAGYAGGLPLGLLTAAGITAAGLLAAVVGVRLPAPLLSFLSVVAAGVIGGMVAGMRRRTFAGTALLGLSGLLLGGFFAGAAAEGAHSLLTLLFPTRPVTAVVAITEAAYSAAANGFGCVLLALVLNDANERRVAQQRRVQAEQELAALRLSQMGELQARLHPHFLFNALAGIAGLCLTDPAQAERGVTSLAVLLRRFLRTPAESSVPLGEEMETVRSYLAIERLRMEDRLRVVEDLPAEALALPVPRFCLQVPVENAVQHGIAPLGRPGCLWIVARLSRRHLILAVGDDGVGVSPPPTAGAPAAAPHGLTLLTDRLRLAFGPAARLRLCRRPAGGTLCVLRLPR